MVTQECIHNDTGANQVENRNPMAVPTNKWSCLTLAVKETVSQTMNRTINFPGSGRSSFPNPQSGYIACDREIHHVNEVAATVRSKTPNVQLSSVRYTT
jgi:hypothetical protein